MSNARDYLYTTNQYNNIVYLYQIEDESVLVDNTIKGDVNFYISCYNV